MLKFYLDMQLFNKKCYLDGKYLGHLLNYVWLCQNIDRLTKRYVSVNFNMA